MTGMIDARLAELGLTLPDAPAPAANYIPYVIAGDLVFVSGQIPIGPDGLQTGIVGQDVTTEQAAGAAKLSCASAAAP